MLDELVAIRPRSDDRHDVSSWLECTTTRRSVLEPAPLPRGARRAKPRYYTSRPYLAARLTGARRAGSWARLGVGGREDTEHRGFPPDMIWRVDLRRLPKRERRMSMLSKEDNELLCRVGRARRWATSCASTGSRRCPRPSCPRPTARRCGCACSARTSSRSATPPARSGCSPPTARTAAPRCSSGATRRRACAASTTAGSSTSTAAASTCRPSRRRATSRTRCAPRAYPCRDVNGIDLDLHGPARDAAAVPALRDQHAARRAGLRAAA